MKGVHVKREALVSAQANLVREHSRSLVHWSLAAFGTCIALVLLHSLANVGLGGDAAVVDDRGALDIYSATAVLLVLTLYFWSNAMEAAQTLGGAEAWLADRGFRVCPRDECPDKKYVYVQLLDEEGCAFGTYVVGSPEVADYAKTYQFQWVRRSGYLY